MEHQPLGNTIVVLVKVHIEDKIIFKDIKILKVEGSKNFCKNI